MAALPLVPLTITADGNYNLGTWAGGACAIAVQGTFTAGEVKLQLSSDGGTTYTDAGSNTTFTANGFGIVEPGLGWLLRMVATGFTGSVSVKASPIMTTVQTRV